MSNLGHRLALLKHAITMNAVIVCPEEHEVYFAASYAIQ